MCGITGIARADSPAPRSLHPQTMLHRGPDDGGEWWSADGRVGLAQRRLAIIDLSPGGHQPMLGRGGRHILVFNGELYNYRELKAELAARGHVFATQSDTEVLLAAYAQWGDDCLIRLNGMFAFALFDADRERLLLARDRAGEKPLFYHLRDGELRFASELKALLADPSLPRRLAPGALDSYLAIGYAPGESCLLEGFNKLPPAHRMVFDLRSGRADVARWWSMPALQDGAAAADDVSLLDEFEALLEDAVRRQLVADVPVGVLLSGGVDSSLVTALAARASSRVRTFTVGFAGHRSHDESAHARLVAAHFGTEHTELHAADAGPDLLPTLARQYDEPVNDSSMLPTFLVSRLVRQHCTVALGGDGGDELFGGYPHYARLLKLQQWVGAIPRALRSPLSTLLARLLPTGAKGRNWVQVAGGDLRHGLPLPATHFDVRERRALLGRPLTVPTAESRLAARVPAHASLLQRATRFDFENYLPEDILVKVDRASMLASLELRAPLLDPRVVEFAFGRVPDRLKADATQRKVLLRRLAARVLPPTFDLQRKQGFSIPLGTWLQRGPWREMFLDVLLDPSCLFNRPTVQALLARQAAAGGNSERLFGLVLFELWRREYRVTL